MATPNIGQTPQSDTSNIYLLHHIQYRYSSQYSEHNCKLFFRKKQRTNNAASELQPQTL
jgi:hypothetical protein